MKPYLLFDAGGTLLYPHAEVICDVCTLYGIHMNVDLFLDGFYGAIYKLDNDLRTGADTSWLSKLAATALEKVGVESIVANTIATEACDRCGSEHFWTFSRPWVKYALDQLQAAGYRMSVISNADGTVEQQLRDLDLARYFEKIFDSALVGVEKPDVRIFHYALNRLQLDPAECIYIGDVVSIDVVGANKVGMAAVHIDPYNRYKEWPGYHVTSVADYAEQLITGRLTLRNCMLYPFTSKDQPATGA